MSSTRPRDPPAPRFQRIDHFLLARQGRGISGQVFRLPGIGRAVNGNFALTELRVTAAPQGDRTAATPVALRNPVADFSQESHGGWSVAAAIDGDPKTGWSVDPREGLRHVAIFETWSIGPVSAMLR